MIRCWSAHAAEQVAMLRRADDARVASMAELRATFQGDVQRKRHARDADATYSGRGGDTLWELVRLRLRDIVGSEVSEYIFSSHVMTEYSTNIMILMCYYY